MSVKKSHFKSLFTRVNIVIIAVAMILSAITSYAVTTLTNNKSASSNTSTGTHDHNIDGEHDEDCPMYTKMSTMIHISSGIDEPHSAMMGFQKALKARESGIDVFLFMDVKATDYALKSNNVTFADFKPSQELISEMISKGVKVYVCPHCLKVNGDSMSDVQPGIQELTMDAMMKFSESKSVVTLDY